MTADPRPFDCDNHYYEAIDAFTRHLSKKDAPRCVQWADIGGRKYQVVGGKVSRVVANATFDPITKAGALHDYFRGNPDNKQPWEFLGDIEPIRADYRNNDARLATLDDHGLSAIWLFPTLGMLYEEMLKHDPEGVGITFTAFNRWLLEDWGFEYQNRIHAAPYISLADPAWAVSELQWALDHNAHVVVMRAAAPTTTLGQRSPFDPMFDGFWGLLNEAGIPLVIHAGDSGYTSNGYGVDGFSASFSTAGFKPSIKGFHIEHAAFDFVISSLFEKLFDRFPNLRLASIENGSTFLPDLVRKVTSTTHKMPGYFVNDPVDTLRNNWWINPFWEDDVNEVVEIMGADRVLFGSDWPHIEGMPQPLDYLTELKLLSDADQRRITFDNVTELNSARPAVHA